MKRNAQKLKSILAIRLNGLMQELVINQHQLAAMTGLGQSTISYYLNGARRPGSEELTELCRALHCSADYLLGLSDEPLEAAGLLGWRQRQLLTYCLRGFTLKEAATLVDRSEPWARIETRALRESFGCKTNYQLFYKLGTIDCLYQNTEEAA